MFGLKTSNFGRATAVLIVLAMLFAMTAAIAYGAPGGQPKSAAAWAAELLKEATDFDNQTRGFYISEVARNMDKNASKEVVQAYLVSLGVSFEGMNSFGALSSVGEKINVLIGFYGSLNLPVNRGTVQAFGGEIYAEFTIVNAIAAQMTQQAADALNNHPNVRYVEPDGQVFALGQDVPWGIDRVFNVKQTHSDYDDTPRVGTWSDSKGLGIKVAILDTGIDKDHEDLDVVDGRRFYLRSTGPAFDRLRDDDQYNDVHGHGTHVAGTVAAVDNSIGVVGVAPDVDLYAVKVLTDTGGGSISTVVAGIEWAVEQGIPIINMSLGGSHHSTLQDACNAAYNKGHLLVAAAGNDGKEDGSGENVGYPAKYPSVIAVAASDRDDNRASFSSTGDTVELIAPGVKILSTVPDDGYSDMYDTNRPWSGTSMASPHVAGTAALVWAASTDSGQPNVDIRNNVRNILTSTAEKLKDSDGADLHIYHQGHGMVRADLAVAAVTGSTPDPDPAVNVVLTMDKDEYGTEDEMATLTVVVADEAGSPIEGLIAAAFTTVLNNSTSSSQVEFSETNIAGTYTGNLNISGLDEGSSYTVKVTVVDERDISGYHSAGFEIRSTSLEPDLPTDLSVSVSTDKDTYSWNSWVIITVDVTDPNNENALVEGAAVTVTLYYPDDSGGPSQETAVAYSDGGTTDASGMVSFRYRVGNRAKTGHYTVKAEAKLSGLEDVDSRTFEVVRR